MSMKKEFSDLRHIARENVLHNPKINSADTEEVAVRYLNFLIEETEEVRKEIKSNNKIHLVDELSDIGWVYAVLLELMVERGYIDSVDDVWDHAQRKFDERLPAFLEGSPELWDKIKAEQKEVLQKKHTDTYGN